MSNRKEFEAWYLDVWGCTEDNLDSLFEESPHGNEYYRFGVRLAWQAWQQATKQAEAKCAAMAAEREVAEKLIAELESREVVLPSVQDVHPLGPQSAKVFCEFHRSIVNRCADEIRKVGVKVSIKGA